MGAAIVRGRDIALQTSRSQDGHEHLELVPVEGDYESTGYSCINAVIKFCQERGIPADVWPIYYGVDDHDVPLVVVRKQCHSLRMELAKFRKEELGQHWWLQRVSEWLVSDQIFCVLE